MSQEDEVAGKQESENAQRYEEPRRRDGGGFEQRCRSWSFVARRLRQERNQASGYRRRG